MSYEDFTKIYHGTLMRYIYLSKNLSPAVYEQSKHVENVADWVRIFIRLTNVHKPPKELLDSDAIIEPLKELINVVLECNDKFNEHHQQYIRNIRIISNTVEVFNWVSASNPVDHVEAYVEILKNHMTSFRNDLAKLANYELQMEWIQSWLQTLEKLLEYVKTHYNNGFCWLGTLEFPPCILLGRPPLSLRSMNRTLFIELNNKNSCLRFLQPSRTNFKGNHQYYLTIPARPFDDVYLEPFKKNRFEMKHGEFKNIYLKQAVNVTDEIYLYHCSDCNIIVEDTVKIINLDSCSKMCIMFRSLISGLQLCECDNIKIHFYEESPYISIYDSKNIAIHTTKLGEKTTILTSLSAKVQLLLPHKDRFYRRYVLPTLLKTVIMPNDGIKTSIAR